MRWSLPPLLGLLVAACVPMPPEQDPALHLPPHPQADRLYQQVAETLPWFTAWDLVHQQWFRHEDPRRVLDLLALPDGASVADIGCGSGFYSFRLAREVGPAGLVWALDVHEPTVAFISRRALDATLNPYQNVVSRQSRMDDILLPPRSLDAAWMAHLDFLLHPELLDANRRLLRSVLQALVPGGHLFVLQWVDSDTRPTHLVPNLQSAGFVLDRHQSFPAFGSYLYSFRRPGSDP